MSQDFYRKSELQEFIAEIKNTETIRIKLNDATLKYLEPSSFSLSSCNIDDKSRLTAKVTFVNENHLWFRIDFPVRKDERTKKLTMGFTSLSAFDAYKLYRANLLQCTSEKK